MTVSSDIDRVIRRLQAAGMTSVEADIWLEERSEAGNTPLFLIESGRTDEVLAQIDLIPQRS